MATGEKVDLVGDMRSIPKSELWRTEVQDYVEQCYARIWINLCLTHRIQPPKASSCTHRAHRDILPAFCKAVGNIGLHLPETVPDYHAPRVALLASELWRKAVNEKARQVAANALPGIQEPRPAHTLGVGNAAARSAAASAPATGGAA